MQYGEMGTGKYMNCWEGQVHKETRNIQKHIYKTINRSTACAMIFLIGIFQLG